MATCDGSPIEAAPVRHFTEESNEKSQMFCCTLCSMKCGAPWRTVAQYGAPIGLEPSRSELTRSLKSLGGNPVRVRIPARALHLALPAGHIRLTSGTDCTTACTKAIECPTRRQRHGSDRAHISREGEAWMSGGDREQFERLRELRVRLLYDLHRMMLEEIQPSDRAVFPH
jgi:hypothetical protein